MRRFKCRQLPRAATGKCNCNCRSNSSNYISNSHSSNMLKRRRQQQLQQQVLWHLPGILLARLLPHSFLAAVERFLGQQREIDREYAGELQR